MNKSNSSRILLIIFILSLYNCCLTLQPACAQTFNSTMKHSDTLTLLINEKQITNDSLEIVLTSFSHKHAMTGGPTKATAYVTLLDGNETKDFLLSVHGKDGKTEIEYCDPVAWKDWTFELIDFNYDQSVKIFVTKEIVEK